MNDIGSSDTFDRTNVKCCICSRTIWSNHHNIDNSEFKCCTECYIDSTKEVIDDKMIRNALGDYGKNLVDSHIISKVPKKPTDEDMRFAMISATCVFAAMAFVFFGIMCFIGPAPHLKHTIKETEIFILNIFGMIISMIGAMITYYHKPNK